MMLDPRHVPLGFVALGGMCLVLFAFAGPAPGLFVFDRGAVADGEVWRLLTAHFVHSDGSHLVLNVLGLLLIGAIFTTLLDRLPLHFVTCVAVIDGWIWFLEPQLQQYCGLSGVLYGLLAAALLIAFRQGRGRWIILTVGFVGLGKLMVELSSGWVIVDHMDWPVLPGAHAAGIGAGILFAILKSSLRKVPVLQFSAVRDPRR